MNGGRRRGVGVIVAVFLAAWLLALGLLGLREARAQDGFDFLTWELQTLPNRWLFTIGALLRDDPPADEAIRGYFIADRDSAEAARLENVVEAAIERRIASVARDLDIDPFGPSLPGLRVFPPVDVELADAPRVLVRSPRNEILRLDTVVLRPDLAADAALAREAAEEQAHADVSVLVVPSGGLAAYPAVVSRRSSYPSTVATAAHEWTHHYLTFYPLGRAYFASAEGRTINETVADIVGDEIASEVLRRWGDPTAPPPAAAAPATAPAQNGGASAPPRVDAAPVLRALRLEVDGLLAAGQVEAAERRMEAVRLELAQEGVQIRRINQAYFAWYGAYAARADATDPLGEQLRALRERAGSLAAFLTAVRGITTREGVADALTK